MVSVRFSVSPSYSLEWIKPASANRGSLALSAQIQAQAVAVVSRNRRRNFSTDHKQATVSLLAKTTSFGECPSAATLRRLARSKNGSELDIGKTAVTCIVEVVIQETRESIMLVFGRRGNAVHRTVPQNVA